MNIVHSLILLGGGGHAAVVAETARAAGFIVLGYLDDRAPPAGTPDSPIAGFKRLGGIADLPRAMADHRHAFFHAAVDDNALRAKWLDLPSPRGTPAIIHPSAIISPTAKIEEGVFVGPRAVINARALVRRGAIVNSAAVVEHDCVLEPFCHCAPGCVLAGEVRIGAGALVGEGAVVVQGVSVGDGATLSPGSVAVDEVSAKATANGVPARAAG
jgi:sugar O-acyltransferase (sialic acid O-acetyltransferase NeuD family)